ncbi:tRNA 5-methylaminomethyl-2-thiouridine biosynthesis bifunctional protein MnmC [Piscirickettsia salmonis]|uniref:FAD-dependent 5-carboxymethylaminomethyl-2-thiouridine(34) oxidoreductase MnmC n=1 Tax=Piscirickettsia salmonis TaxID=1238 RepID=UPI0012BA7027|nr:FAD-dependent 5-carboxymethylaminomethyl-2-thiouridine(34) oxidoreductase MnmC [Piscirickettsia salmonis]QGP54238.1 tRNA 5-methylaminomethyl-2-thiouridine biosynthesis bifunctional protein MnmC [Piscirickettsia salmonis]QGP63815.1 tRNA 5-methylaminomethyl-2-thiouridine biosynthesis bifunctional protein MnmC [Piscirickettsia salmonis]
MTMLVEGNYAPWNRLAASVTSPNVIVVGAGIAGASTSWALSTQGFNVTLVEKAAEAAQEASGNLAGLMMPALATDQSSFAEYFIQAYLYSIQHAKTLAQSHQFNFSQTGIIQLAFNDRQQKRQKNWLELEHVADLLEWVSQEQVMALSGLDFSCSGVYFKEAAWLSPYLYVKSHIHACKTSINCLFNCYVNQLHYEQGLWKLYDQHQHLIAEAPTLILANASDATRLLGQFSSVLPLSLRTVRGQVSALENHARISQLKLPVCYDGYITPVINGKNYLGATFIDDYQAKCLHQDRVQNIQQLKQVLPGLNIDKREYKDISQDRAALRCITTDYLPVIGPVPDVAFYRQHYSRLIQDRRESRYPSAQYLPGLFMNIGHGSRGMVSAPFATKLLVSELMGKNLKLSKRLREHLHPGRFLIRQLKKGK